MIYARIYLWIYVGVSSYAYFKVTPFSRMVTKVEVAADAYLACLTHALSTEREEVMGLLLGEVN